MYMHTHIYINTHTHTLISSMFSALRLRVERIWKGRSLLVCKSIATASASMTKDVVPGWMAWGRTCTRSGYLPVGVGVGVGGCVCMRM